MYSNNRDKNQFEEKAQELERVARQLAAKHLMYGSSELYFEAQRFISLVKRDIESNCLTYQGGVGLIVEQINHLLAQDTALTFKRASIYLVVEKDRKATTTIALKQIGFVSGGAQVYARHQQYV